MEVKIQYLRKVTRIIILILVCIFLVFAGRAIINFTKPTVAVVMQQPYNPTNSMVKINNTLVYPSGKGGNLYTQKVNVGEAKVEIFGPYIEAKTATVKTQILKKSDVSLSVKSVSVEEIIKKNQNISNGTIHNIRKFNDGWLVAQITDSGKNTEDGNSYSVALHYDTNEKIWKDLTDKLILNDKSLTVNVEVKNYLYELSDD